MSASWRKPVKRQDARPELWYTRARVLGIDIEHFDTVAVRVFESRPSGDHRIVAPGVFRAIGSVYFMKDTRRWKAVIWNGASAVDVSTLLAEACRLSERHGSRPGQGLRAHWWNHYTGHDGRRRACAHFAYRLTEADLLVDQETAAVVPDTIESLSMEVDAHYAELLREAAES